MHDFSNLILMCTILQIGNSTVKANGSISMLNLEHDIITTV